MRYGRIVRPLAAAAALESVDDSAARRMPGVTVVRDGDLARRGRVEHATSGRAPLRPCARSGSR